MNIDFSNLGWRSARRVPNPVQLECIHEPWPIARRRINEAFRGSAIVTWQGKIERQLQEFVDENTEARNHAYADKLRTFLALWRNHPLDGSVNVETIEKLLAATEVSAVDDWKYASYFSHLRDQLRRLKASVEELPMTDEVPPEQRAPSSSPPSSFGPTDEPPAGAAPPEGQPAQPGDEDLQAAGDLTAEAPEGGPTPEDDRPALT